MFGGGYLCFEGVEKLVHKFLHPAEERDEHVKLLEAVADPHIDLVALEKDKVKGAVRTDFILSAEIVTIALGTVAAAPFLTRLAVLTGLGLLMTIGVYGLVASIVKLDDLGLYLTERGRATGGSGGGASAALGAGLLRLSPILMKLLSIAGTAAMFLVGGGILTHGIPGLHDWVHEKAEAFHYVPGASTLLQTLADVLVGVAAGALVLLLVGAVKRTLARGRSTHPEPR
jgi:predicted DNA repair protein MutK